MLALPGLPQKPDMTRTAQFGRERSEAEVNRTLLAEQ
jgi:hypothetical protein